MGIRGHEPLAQRLQREFRARRHRPRRLLAARQHLERSEEREPAAARLERLACELEPRDLPVAVRDLHLGQRRPLARGEGARNRVLREFRVVLLDQFRQAAPDQLGHRGADQRGEGLVDRLDALAVQQRGFAHGGEHGAGAVGRRRDALAHPLVRGFRLVHELPQPAPLHPGDDGEHGGENRERDTSDHRDRHAVCHPLRFRADATAPYFSLCSAASGSISHACTRPPGDSP